MENLCILTKYLLFENKYCVFQRRFCDEPVKGRYLGNKGSYMKMQHFVTKVMIC